MSDERRDLSQLMDMIEKKFNDQKNSTKEMLTPLIERIEKITITVYGDDSTSKPGMKLTVDRIDARLAGIESSVSRWKNYTTGALVAGLSGWAHKIGASLFK